MSKLTLKRMSFCRIIGDYDALLVRSSTEVTAKVIEAGKTAEVYRSCRCRCGQYRYGCGNPQRHYRCQCAGRQHPCCNRAHHGNDALAGPQHPAGNREPEEEGMEAFSKFMGVELNEKMLGIVGFGRIGRELAKRANRDGYEMCCL